MELNKLSMALGADPDQNTVKAYAEFENLLSALRKKHMAAHLVVVINQHIAELNAFAGSAIAITKELRKHKMEILKLIEKEASLVTKNHYRKLWLVIGMVAFGLPLGIVFGAGFDNMPLMAIGMPIGMIFGFAIGNALDKKAFENGNQLDLIIKY